MVFRTFLKIFPASAVIVIGICNVYFYFSEYLPENFWFIYVAIVNPILALIATAVMFYSAVFSSKKAELKQIYFRLSLAFFLYFTAEAVWSFYEALTGSELSYPSLADLLWIIGTIILISELLIYANSSDTEISVAKLLSFYSILTMAIVLLIKFAFFEVIIAGFSVDYTPLQKAVDIFYFTGDILIIYATGLIIIKRLTVIGWKDDVAWILLLIGMLAMISGDVSYTYVKLQGTNNVYLLEDLLYSFQYIFWVLGGAMFPITPQTVKKSKTGVKR